MARPADSLRPRGPRTRLGAALEDLLEPSRERLELALRLTLICGLTTVATAYYRLPEPALTAYLVFFLNRPARTTSLIMNVALVVLISIVIGLIFLLAMVVADAPAWRVVAMALSSAAFLFLASASKLRPVGPILALIVAYALDLLGSIPQGELATRALLYAWLFVAVPAGVSLVVNLVLAPGPRRLAQAAIAERLRVASALLRGPDGPQLKAFARHREAGATEILEWLHLAQVERTLPEAVAPHLAAAATATPVILLLADALRRDRATPGDWRAGAARALDEMADAFDAGGYPVGVQIPPPADADRSTALMRDFEAVLALDPAAPPQAAEAEPKGGFFLADAFSNPEHVHYALKTTAAAMFCYFLYVLLDWPGIHTCLITCYIVGLGTTGETVEKLSLRVLGCLFGGAAGMAALVWVLPGFDSIWGLLAVVSVGAFGGGWVAAGSPRIGYAGFQFAFAFFLCVLQGSGPAFDLTIARDRLIGILVGNAVTYLVFTRLWPVSVSQRIEQALSGLLRELAEIARAPLAARRQRASALIARTMAIRDDLALVSFEPPAVRPAPAWSASRQAALRAMTGLEGPLLLDGEPPFWSALAETLERLAAAYPDRAGDGPPVARPPVAGPLPGNRLQARAREQVVLLEMALDPR